MRTPRRVDRNQAEIVAALRKAGCSVQSLASIGKGCPDLLVGHAGKNYLFEIKDGSAPESRRQMTDEECDWFESWEGEYLLIEDVESAFFALGLSDLPRC